MLLSLDIIFIVFSSITLKNLVNHFSYLTPRRTGEQTQSKAPVSVSQWHAPSFHPRSIHVPLQTLFPPTAHVISLFSLNLRFSSSKGIAAWKVILSNMIDWFSLEYFEINENIMYRSNATYRLRISPNPKIWEVQTLSSWYNCCATILIN